MGAENTTSAPSEKGAGGADERPEAGNDRNKRNGGQAAGAPLASALAAVALLAVAQRLRDEAADQLLPGLMLSAFIIGRQALNAAERASGLALVRDASPEQLTAIWRDAAKHIEELAAGFESPFSA